jgi:hypothetical protein
MTSFLQLGPFEFRPAGVVIKGKPSLDDWEGPLSFALWCQRASPWWIGDMLNAGDDSFGELFSQICEGYGVSAEMVQRYKSVARRVPARNRVESLSWSAHAVVARLPVEKQRRALMEAERRGWTSEELRRYLRPKPKSSKDPSAQPFDQLEADSDDISTTNEPS